jgi:hypothetical protein
MLELTTKLTNPKEFFEWIPRDLEKNLLFRQELHQILAKSPEFQDLFKQMCFEEPGIAFSSAFWTYNPRKPAGLRNLPFILRPAQVEAVHEIKNAIDFGHDLLIDKSRDEGATEIISKMFALYFLCVPETSLLVGSRKEEYVDAGTQINNQRVSGSPRCIFHKILYAFSTGPIWMQPKLNKTHMHIENLDNGSILDGESTNENFGAGDRRTAILLDEFGRVDHKLAQNIRESVADVSDCVIYNSTHFYGRGHPYAKLRFSGKLKVVLLPWYKNPEKKQGLYKSPDLDEIEIYDEKYYEDRWPGVFKKAFKLSDIEKDLLLQDAEGEFPTFIADGSDKWRSPWYDTEEKRRDPRDVAQNIDMNPAGAGDNFFDHYVLARLRTDKMRKPSVVGDFSFDYTIKGQLTNIKWRPGGGHKRFRWWGSLPLGRPNQAHNYIVCCDISLGTGASNSVAKVYDANTRECVGMFITSQLPPSEFADHVIAMCRWVGGRNGTPFLAWEANGPGNAFDARRRAHRYNYVYYDANYQLRNRKKSKKPGWYNTDKSSYAGLLLLRDALSESLKTIKLGAYLHTYDEDTIQEYEDYIVYENGKIGPSGCVDDTAGAKKAHGDTVIPDVIFMFAMREQPKASNMQMLPFYQGTMAFRRAKALDVIRKERQDSPWLVD